MTRKLTNKEFLKRAHIRFSNKFTYLTEYINESTEILIHCPTLSWGRVHGNFLQTPHGHFKSKFACPKCSSNQKLTVEEFKWRGKFVHGDLYNYDLVKEINGCEELVNIKCNTCKLIFPQRPNNHLNAEDGCPDCRYDFISEKFTKPNEKYIAQATKIHDGLYDYSKVIYKNSQEDIIVICKIHGEFLTNPNNHIHTVNKTGCPKCGLIERGLKRRSDTETFINKANIIHNFKYDYSQTKYTLNKNEVNIICPKHGLFSQIASYHLDGNGCSRCKNKTQHIWLDFLNVPKSCRKIKKFHVKNGNSKILPDAYDPVNKIVFEFDGDLWHGNPELYKPDDKNPVNHKTYKYLYEKTLSKRMAYKSANLRLVSIWENDYNKYIKENITWLQFLTFEEKCNLMDILKVF